uniref:Pollen allergen Cyn d 23 n=1 Tax=Cynodon dactylon TaxID=28909 RepID=Q7XYF3_CYNDA|nr:pollen allergen Cyn d 23 [Cynodon dactylon]
MAKVIAIILVATMVTAALVPIECATVIDKELERKAKEALDAVIASAPPEKKSETTDAAVNLMAMSFICIGWAKKAGNEEEVVARINDFKKAADQVLAAAPAHKYKVMEETFKAVPCAL